MKSWKMLPILCSCLFAQPAREMRDLSVTQASDAGTVTVRLHNDYSAPATAWILQCVAPPNGSRFYWNDEELNFDSKPLAPGAEIEIQIRTALRFVRLPEGDQPPMCADFHPIAAAFADGTVSGDLRWINAIVENRREAYQDIAKVADILKNAIDKGTETAAVVQEITDGQKARQPGGMRVRATPIFGPRSGWRTRGGTGPPGMRLVRSPVASAALWLVDNQGKTLPEAVKALAEWRGRLASLAGVTEAPKLPILSLPRESTPFTAPSDAELVGKPAPDFTLKDVDGHEVTLASLRGKPILLDFWATWCEPCREELPYIQKLYQQFKDNGLTVVCIDADELAEKPKKYFEEHQYTFDNLLGQGSGVPRKYGVRALPRTVLIAKDGIVRYVHEGWDATMDLTPEVKKVTE